MYRENYLFSEGDLSATLRGHQKLLLTKVDSIPHDQFMNAQIEEIVENIVCEMFVEPLVIYEDQMEMEQQEVKIDVSGYRDRNIFNKPGPIYVSGISASIFIPFTGDISLWKLRPNSWRSIVPHAKIIKENNQNSGALLIQIKQPTDEPLEKVKERLEDILEDIRFYIQSQKGQIDSFNEKLHNQVLTAVNTRRETVKKHEGLKDILGIPLKRKEGAPSIEPLKIKRKLVRPIPPSPKSGFKPEPGIIEEDYMHILSVIRHEGRTFETTPKVFSVHKEEELRDIMLAHLNGHYQGDAAGEVFRRKGKTDIRIEDKERAAFVAECKIWEGPNKMYEAIDQLLGYLTWRDCKAAIVIFNKNNAVFSKILEAIPNIFQKHSKFKREVNTKEHGEWEFHMTSFEDEGRQVRIRVFVFNLFIR
jgi:hypothetical protein